MADSLEDASQTHEICFASEISARKKRAGAFPSIFPSGDGWRGGFG